MTNKGATNINDGLEGAAEGGHINIIKQIILMKRLDMLVKEDI